MKKSLQLFKKNLFILCATIALWNSNSLTAQSPTIIGNVPFVYPPNSMYEKSPVLGNNRFFTDGAEIWKTNGTIAGTQILKSFTVTNSNATVTSLENINNSLYFFDNTSNSNYCNLYKSDGTTAGTTIIQTFTASFSSRGKRLTQINGTAYFILEQGAQHLWKTDGTAQGCALVKSSLAITSPFLNANGTTVFFAYNTAATRLALWKTDGTGVGTVILKDSICQPSMGETTQDFTDVNGTIFFKIANKGELWKTNGTSAGTQLVSTQVNYAQSFTSLNGALYFSNVSSFFSGPELWTSDGTNAGTIATVNPRVSSGPTAFKNNLYLGKTDLGGASNNELYTSNGTQAGTTLLKDIFTGAPSSYPQYYLPVNNTLCFTATDANKQQIWKTDGTTNGTSMAYAVADTLISFTQGNTFNTINGYLLFNYNNKAYSLFVDASAMGINQITKADATLIYPNPTKDNLTVKLSSVPTSGTKINFMDITGRKIKEMDLNSEINLIDISVFHSGIYFYSISNNSRISSTGKFIKE